MIDDEQATKLTKAKIRFAEEQRFMHIERKDDATGRLPNGQSRVKGLPVLDLGVQPEIDLENWSLTLDGHVSEVWTLDWGFFNELTKVETHVDIHCVTSWSSFDNKWIGVPMRTLINMARPLPDATHVMLHSSDGYTTNVPIDDLLSTNCIVATSWNGDPLSSSHGGPARLVIPHLYFWKSAKWICRIEFMTQDAPGYWEQRGYHNDGDPWQEQRYAERLLKPETPPEPVQIVSVEVAPAEQPSLAARIAGWVRYHFFPD